MAGQLKTRDSLISEYIRSSLFGENIKRRALSQIKGDMTHLCGEESAELCDALDAKVAKITAIGKDAATLARKGVADDSLELENLLIEAKNIGNDAASQYVLKVYQEAEDISNFSTPFSNRPCARPAKSVPKVGKTKPKVIKGEDFFTGNSFRPALLTPDGSFPKSWTKCYYTCDTMDFGQLMYKYCLCSLWGEGQSKEDAKSMIVSDLRRLFCDDVRIDNAIEVANAWLEKAKPVLSSAIKRASDTPEEAALICEIGGPLRSAIDRERAKKRERNEKSVVANKHIVEIVGLAGQPAPSSKFGCVPQMTHESRMITRYPGHPNEIYNLSPAREWTLYIDESGDDRAFETGTDMPGVIAGALSCVDNPLPNQPTLHASTDSTEELMKAGDKVIETLLNHGQCGVLAIPASVYASAQGWASLIASFIDIVLRLLPMPEGKAKVKLNIFVEGRAPYNTEVDFNFLRDACRYNLMHVFPERANRISFDIKAMDKKGKHNAYPDLIAHTCALGRSRKNKLPASRFVASGWDGTCFLNYPATELRNLLEYFFAGRSLPPAEWDSLLQTEASSKTGLLSAIIRTLGIEARGRLPLWKEYLDWTVAHLSSKAINLRKLHTQLAWLKTYQPAEAEIPPRVKLLWLTSKLAESNHLGEIENQSPVGQEFLRLVEDLYEEDAPLVCWAVLHLAVQKTNAYQFEDARRLVTDFSDIGSLISKEPPFTRLLKGVVRKLTGDKTMDNYAPAAIPGLRYYGQLLSSCGQHEAFLGNAEKAILYFREAISCFERLSENKSLDIDQTMAYLATAQMDITPTSKETEKVMERYLGGSVVDIASRLATSMEDKDKYHHHILLRYLTQSKNMDATKAYLEAKSNWKIGEGHPWEMIEFYRALLVDDDGERKKHFDNAFQIAQNEGGATLQVIASVILGGERYYNHDMDGKKLQACIESALSAVPSLGQKRINALKQQVTNPIPPLELAKIVLPFNFR